MQNTVQITLLALTYLMFKHMIADFILQKPYQFLNKGTYGHLGGILHAGIHAIMSLPVFFFLPPATMFWAMAIIFGEFIAHYHIDWIKEQSVKKFAWAPDQQNFWTALGIDQFAHALTYIAIVWSLTA